MAGILKLPRDSKELLELLNANDVRYLIVGGCAVGIHGRPRFTKDLDIWLESSPENAARIITALNQFGFATAGFTAADFQSADQIVQLGRSPYRIDLITGVSGLVFQECYDKRLVTVLDGVSVNVIDLESLKKNKRATGRLQDLADADNLP